MHVYTSMYIANLNVCLYSQEWLVASLAGAAGMVPLLNVLSVSAIDDTGMDYP